ncbi:DNA-directed RNA polymerase I subunit RPA43 [Onthophagus taurus]|uniref:DNA-directed RNA polymerase I subunit RPA43 n=1 Tax=Onthophagus taurus TaxID=166361 RepID=UPI0039BE4EB6
MRKLNNRTISFDKNFLRKLKEDSNSCVHIQKDVKRLPIHPFRLIDINACIKDIFQTKIAKYDEKLNGILLGYQNITLLDSDRGTFDGSFTHMDIEGEFYVFRPIIGSILNGIVNKKSKDHVGCLVYNTFNVSLPRPQGEETWLGQNINIGSEVQFKINFTNMDSKLPYIRGELQSIINDSGFSADDSFLKQSNKIKFNDSDDEETTKKLIKKHKKAKHKELEQDFQEIKLKRSKKNKKERQSEEISLEIDEKNVKKNHKKDKPMNSDLNQLEESETLIKSKRKKNKHKNESKNESLNQSYSENDKIDENEIMQTSKERKRKREDQTDEFNEILTQDFDKKSKKHKKQKEKAELIDDDLNQFEENEKIEKVKRKKNRLKDKEDFLESLMHNIDEEFDPKIKKHKKHKRKKEENQNEEDGFTQNLYVETINEEICSKKHKKKKKEKN